MIPSDIYPMWTFCQCNNSHKRKCHDGVRIHFWYVFLHYDTDNKMLGYLARCLFQYDFLRKIYILKVVHPVTMVNIQIETFWKFLLFQSLRVRRDIPFNAVRVMVNPRRERPLQELFNIYVFPIPDDFLVRIAMPNLSSKSSTYCHLRQRRRICCHWLRTLQIERKT